jgi:hypothetical protein
MIERAAMIELATACDNLIANHCCRNYQIVQSPPVATKSLGKDGFSHNAQDHENHHTPWLCSEQMAVMSSSGRTVMEAGSFALPGTFTDDAHE